MLNASREMARVVVCSLLCLLGSTAISLSQQLKPEDLYNKVLPSVMTLSVEKKDGSSGVGTAFLSLKEGTAVTAWHVVRGAVRVTAKFSTGEEFESSGLIDKDEKRDAALIRVKVFGRPLLQPCSSEPAVGVKAYLIGAPRGLEFSISDGLISQIQTLDAVKNYQFTCAASPGNSGGPLLNDKGEVIGVASWQVREGQNLNFAVPISYVLGLDSTLATQPWDQIRPAPDGGQPGGEQALDKQIGCALLALADCAAGLDYVDGVTNGTGYRRGVPRTLYVVQQRMHAAVAALRNASSADPRREQIIASCLSTAADLDKAVDLMTSAIVEAQDTGWQSTSTSLCTRAMAVRGALPVSISQTVSDVRDALRESPALTEALPAEAQYAMGIREGPSGFALHVVNFPSDPMVLSFVRSYRLGRDIGFRSGDRIISIGEKQFKTTDSLEDVKLLIKQSLGQKLDVVVERGGKQQKITLKIPKEIPKESLHQ